jgi:hypothetical protein
MWSNELGRQGKHKVGRKLVVLLKGMHDRDAADGSVIISVLQDSTFVILAQHLSLSVVVLPPPYLCQPQGRGGNLS